MEIIILIIAAFLLWVGVRVYKSINSTRMVYDDRHFKQGDVEVIFKERIINIGKHTFSVSQVTNITAEPYSTNKFGKGSQAWKAIIEIEDFKKPRHEMEFFSRKKANEFVQRLATAVKKSGGPILFVLLFFVASITATAQRPTLGIGLKAGFNQPFFKTNYNSANEYTTDDNFLYAGITSDLRFNRRFGLQTDLFWQRDPVQYYLITSGTGYIIQEQADYLSIPVLAKYHLGKISFYGGPQISLLTHAELPNLVNLSGQRYSVNVTDSSYKKTRYSAVVGLEWAFKYRFGIDVRYMTALGNIAKPNGASPLTSGPNPSVKISNIQAGLFFRFGKKPKFLADEKKKS